MHSISVWWRAAGRVGLVFLLVFGVSGCPRKPTPSEGRPYCGDKNVTVNTSTGANPVAVYVCGGDTVTWNPTADEDFLIEFKNDYPFEGNKKNFDKKDRKSPKAKPHNQLKVYEYKVTVSGQTFDPQVVGGGNP